MLFSNKIKMNILINLLYNNLLKENNEMSMNIKLSASLVYVLQNLDSIQINRIK